MSKRLKRLLTLCLAVFYILSSALSTYANEKVNFQFSDEDGHLFGIQIEEKGESRITLLYDDNGNVIQKMHFDKKTGILTNMNTGTSLRIDAAISPEPCSTNKTRAKEYEFCTKGETYSTEETVTVGEILAIVGVTATVPEIVAAILTLTGAASLGSASATVQKLAYKIRKCIKNKENDTEIQMKFTFKCVEIWESDSSYTGGGFCFLGYQVSKFSGSL